MLRAPSIAGVPPKASPAGFPFWFSQRPDKSCTVVWGHGVITTTDVVFRGRDTSLMTAWACDESLVLCRSLWVFDTPQSRCPGSL